ncbi:GerW family sporulation protein [Thermosyntropha sp.]|uniref:GerW family sporulation protein n=1 Tax=Thermosyntropha sp. TaxID=2740820 RepID=UPI0025F76DA8|nr:GerW family sporulation protein [Thermosyntropha sp.]MBO8159953.1 GerW family sporulation protein [Thermosyntropha sp.]
MENMENTNKPHPIEALMKTAMQNIKEMVDVSTVVGDAVETNDGTVIIPVSQVATGFAAGGGEYELSDVKKGDSLPFAGGSGAGVSVKPVGFLVVRMNDVRLISVKGNPLAERIVDLAPQFIEKMESIISQKNKNGKNEEQKVQ